MSRVSRLATAFKGGVTTRLTTTILVVIACLVATAPLMGGPKASAATRGWVSISATTATDLPAMPAAVQSLAYSGGRAFVSWTPGQGVEADSYHVESYLVTGKGLVDKGGIHVAGDDTVVSGLAPGSPYVFAVSAVTSRGVVYE